MRKATVTYHAQGENKVVEWLGITFYDGQPVELNTIDNEFMLGKMANNRFFDVEMGEEESDPPKSKRGRPPGSKNRDLKAGMLEAADHDFEADRRNGPQKGQGEDNVLGNTGTSPAPKQGMASGTVGQATNAPVDQPKQPAPTFAQAEPQASPLAEPTKVDDKK